MSSRRDVLRATTAAGAAFLLDPWPRATHAASVSLYSDLLKTWCDRLLELQIDAPKDLTRDGALRCPACNFLHGRCHDAAYPLLHLAHVTGERRYLDAAVRLQRWSDNVSDPDGAFRNELAPGSWRGITVFAVIALAEALHHHGAVLDPKSRARWQERLASAARFLDGFVTMQTGNINYPVTSALAFTLAGQVLDLPRSGIAAARSRMPRSPISRRAACCSACRRASTTRSRQGAVCGQPPPRLAHDLRCGRGAAMIREPSQCMLWNHTPLTGGFLDDFFLNGCEVVETYADDGHLSRRLIRCRECGQVYFKEFYEIVDWVGGNDAQYITLIPVETLEDIETTKKADVLRIMDFLPQLRIDWPSDAKERTICWQGRE